MSKDQIEISQKELEFAHIKRYSCSVHGEHDAYMNIKIFNQEINRKTTLERNYCMYCYINFLDLHRVQDMEPISEKRSAI